MLKKVQGISVCIAPEEKTIVTLDLQPYTKFMELCIKENRNNFIFRLGELHVVFAYLKVLGKYIMGSGLDQLLLEVNAYGPTKLGYILTRKYMKRSSEVHMIIYLSLMKIFLVTFGSEITGKHDLKSIKKNNRITDRK